ncbi:hypothetical protein ICJ33_16820 [Pseudomonas simiae]|uniref:hypothetical protein n=1 Tax=Pseudomonas simiae TaxID=321846 RepID=UPI0018E32577|nr:hypothetical protein [Pseudomonas simiae]QQD25958.1 hypothetical protein ICJ33_16820 [Pseudomonas simiae]
MKEWKLDKIALATGAFSTIYGCSTPVELTIKNNTAMPLTATIEVYEKNNQKEPNDIGIGEISPGSNIISDFKVANNGSFIVKGASQGNIPISNSGRISVTNSKNTLKREVTLNTTVKQLDSSSAMDTISSSFKKIGLDLGATPLPLKTALETRIGALVVADRGTSTQPGQIYYSVAPNVFGVKVMRVDEVDHLDTEESNQIDSTGATAITASLQFGPFGSFGAAYKANSVYQFRWRLKGFGPLQKIEDTQLDPSKLLGKLSTEQIYQIKSSLQNHPSAKVYYINSYYYLRQAELTVREAKEAKGEAAGTGLVYSAGTTYTFNDTSEAKYSYGPVVLNYWGEEFNLLEVVNPQKNITTIAGTPETGKETIPLLTPTMRSKTDLSNLNIGDGVFAPPVSEKQTQTHD